MSESLRVALVVPRFLPWRGGVETHVARLATRLGAHGLSAEILTSTDGTAPRDEFRDGYRVRRFTLPVRRVWDLPSPEMLKTLRAEAGRFDVIHAHNYHALPGLFAAVAKQDTPMVFTPHYHGTGRTAVRSALHGLYRPMGRFLVARADHLVAVTPGERELLVRHFGSDIRGRISVIPNGVDPVIDDEQPFSRARRTVLAVSRMESYKSMDVLVRMVGHLPEDIELVVVGEGPEREHLEALARATGVASRVVFTGRVTDEDLARWWPTARAFVSASRFEAFGLTVAESLARGIPVVASDIPAHRDVRALARGGPSMALVPQGADAPRRFAEEVRGALSEAAVRSPAELPLWDEVATRTVELYQRLGRGVQHHS